jgi:hypothetical protein
MDASHTNANTAYAAVNRIRLDDMKPHIYKTTDGGKTWKEIVNGLPDDPINVVKEDPIKKGLLFAGSERAVYVSFDDGEHWQSLRLNMPATSIRDLVIKDDDIVAGTHGRSFWILDNISPLRQLTKDQFHDQITNRSIVLYSPQSAYRVRWSMYTDTPLPQEEPAGDNPPDGAMIDYYLNDKAEDVTLTIKNYQTGAIIRTYSNKDSLYKIGDVNIPHYWIRPQQLLSNEAGHHRFLWDMRYAPLNVPPSYPISAIYKNTAPDVTSPFVMPGDYAIILTVGKQSFASMVTIKMDPRVKTANKDLQLQHDLSLMCYHNILQCMKLLEGIAADSDKAKALSKFINQFTVIHNALQDSDWPPTKQMISTATTTKAAFEKFLKESK